MDVVTTRHGPTGPKPFAWSYSKLKNFETCPKRHFHVDVARDVKEDESDELKWGGFVHKSAADFLGPKGIALPPEAKILKPWCERILATPGSNILVEQKLALSKDFGPASWFGDGAWFRGIADVIKIMGPVALVVDWKTGKILEDSVQLALTAACVFAHHQDVHKIRTEFVWLKENADTRADFRRSEMPEIWKNLWPRIEQLRRAHETSSYPAKPGKLCRKWCPVTKCPHHGE